MGSSVAELTTLSILAQTIAFKPDGSQRLTLYVLPRDFTFASTDSVARETAGRHAQISGLTPIYAHSLNVADDPLTTLDAGPYIPRDPRNRASSSQASIGDASESTLSNIGLLQNPMRDMNRIGSARRSFPISIQTQTSLPALLPLRAGRRSYADIASSEVVSQASTQLPPYTPRSWLPANTPEAST